MPSYPVPTINVAAPDDRDVGNEQLPDNHSHFTPSDGETLASPSIRVGLASTVSSAQHSGPLALLRVPSNGSAATSTAHSSEGPHTPGVDDNGSFNVDLSSPSPTHPDFLSHNTTKLRDNDPNVTEGKGSFALLNPRLMADRKRSFVSSVGSAEGTEPDHGPNTPIEISPTLETPHLELNSALHPGKPAETRVKFDLSGDDVPAPFTLPPRHLASCLDPKNLEQVNDWGGTAAVLRSLGIDGVHGLHTEPHVLKTHEKSLNRTPTGEKAATMHGGTVARHAESGSQPPEVEGGNADQSQDVSAVSMEQRRRVYGANILPDRKSKSLLQLMWMALKDRVLVSHREHSLGILAFVPYLGAEIP